jgi:hypothetical protein
LMDVGDFDEHGLFRDEEDGLFEHEKIALDSFQVCLEARMPISTAMYRTSDSDEFC